MREDAPPKITPLIAAIVISIAVVGYFTGLQSPMNRSTIEDSQSQFETVIDSVLVGDKLVIPATAYTDMSSITAFRDSGSILRELESTKDPLAEIKIAPTDKKLALAVREQNRAFNGAPPTIPHPIEQQSPAACIACHGSGVKTTTLRVPKMSHDFLTNCTQCHVGINTNFMVAADAQANDFEGLKAPEKGPRAYTGAPPQIPHTTWMRSDCTSCHGYAGLQGIRTTHPWRQNCQQCHAPSAEMEQASFASNAQFLAPPQISK